MRRPATALFSALLAFGAMAGETGAGAAADGIDIVEPPAAGSGSWNDDQMRGANERLKDILPGRFA